jgi:hypothetical protein
MPRASSLATSARWTTGTIARFVPASICRFRKSANASALFDSGITQFYKMARGAQSRPSRPRTGSIWTRRPRPRSHCRAVRRCGCPRPREAATAIDGCRLVRHDGYPVGECVVVPAALAVSSLTDMANQEHLDILAKGVGEWNAWREQQPDSRPDLSGANLSGAELRGANCSARPEGPGPEGRGPELCEPDPRAAERREPERREPEWRDMFCAVQKSLSRRPREQGQIGLIARA